MCWWYVCPVGWFPSFARESSVCQPSNQQIFYAQVCVAKSNQITSGQDCGWGNLFALPLYLSRKVSWLLIIPGVRTREPHFRRPPWSCSCRGGLAAGASVNATNTSCSAEYGTSRSPPSRGGGGAKVLFRPSFVRVRCDLNRSSIWKNKCRAREPIGVFRSWCCWLFISASLHAEFVPAMIFMTPLLEANKGGWWEFAPSMVVPYVGPVAFCYYWWCWYSAV